MDDDWCVFGGLAQRIKTFPACFTITPKNNHIETLQCTDGFIHYERFPVIALC